MDVDFVIVGQGICGTLLSRNLVHAGKKVLVIDNPDPLTATKIASGVINPLTGKNWTQNHPAEYISIALKTYYDLETELNTPLVSTKPLLYFHESDTQREMFALRKQQGNEYLFTCDDDLWNRYFNCKYGCGTVDPCWLINGNNMLRAWRSKLKSTGSLLEEPFEITKCNIQKDHISYKNITAEKIIFCEGAAVLNNPLFDLFPFTRNMGEVLIISAPDLPRDHLYHQQYRLVPWQNNYFWIGSSHIWNYSVCKPNEEWKLKVVDHLRRLLKVPFRIVDHFAAERPTIAGQTPVAKLHPSYPNVGILNGMGTKGFSTAPFYAQQLTDILLKR